MKVWWQRCGSAALVNLIIWLTPPPVHFVALLMPFFSGYAIASGRRSKGLWPSIQISFVMGLTLGSTILIVSIIAIVIISLVESKITRVYIIVVIIISLAIGSYTAIAAFFGALLAAHREARSTGERSDRS